MGVWPEPDHAAAWSTTDYMLANVCDAIRELTWVTLAINSKHTPKKPEPCYRPGGKPRAPKTKWTDLPKLLTGQDMPTPGPNVLQTPESKHLDNVEQVMGIE